MTPPRLYRYRSVTDLSRVTQIIVDSQLYFTAPQVFNDPFDCKPFMNLEGTTQELEAFFTQLAINKYPGADDATVRSLVRDACGPHMDLGKMASNASQAWNDAFELGICCFSEPNDNILMWSHYADCHKGICLEFECRQSEKLFQYARPVRYTSTYPELHFFKPDRRMGEEFFFSKAVDWSYEREWRVTSDNPGPIAFNPDVLTGIIFGCQATPTTISSIRSWITGRLIALYRAERKTREFGLTIRAL